MAILSFVKPKILGSRHRVLGWGALVLCLWGDGARYLWGDGNPFLLGDGDPLTPGNF